MENLVLGKNVFLEIAKESDLDDILSFQKYIIDNMERREFFTPLTNEEFLAPILGRDNAYLLKYNGEFIGLCVATCDIPDILKDYELDNDNVMLIDSVMVKEEYRGFDLLKQLLDFLYDRAKELKVVGLVATIHPDNVYSLNPFLSKGYLIINKLHLHGGERLIVYKEVID